MGFITTYTGESFNPLQPDLSKIKIDDVAHSLSLLCRGNGHLSHFFSVAQHSINCAKEAEARGLPVRVRLACLLHDASEAYMSDIPRPIKKSLPVFVKTEDNLQSAIYEKFLGSPLTDEECHTVREIDDDMLVNEFVALMKERPIDRVAKLRTTPSFDFVGFNDVEKEFIRAFEVLSSELN
ncbi:MAG: phosphohydrolase [Firmicutes bacterium]|nr:phosphohydrolase [Bacillota bacterium]